MRESRGLYPLPLVLPGLRGRQTTRDRLAQIAGDDDDDDQWLHAHCAFADTRTHPGCAAQTRDFFAHHDGATAAAVLNESHAMRLYSRAGSRPNGQFDVILLQ